MATRKDADAGRLEHGSPVPAFDLNAAHRSSLREIADFPIAGIIFKDLAPLLAQRGLLSNMVAAVVPQVQPLDFDSVLAIDARGFILGASLADRLGAGLILVRKPGKLPGAVESFDYTCEYCSGQLEVTAGSVSPGLKCLIVDDLLATGGTARATADFVTAKGGIVCGYAFMLEIGGLRGREQLGDAPVISLIKC